MSGDSEFIDYIAQWSYDWVQMSVKWTILLCG